MRWTILIFVLLLPTLVWADWDRFGGDKARTRLLDERAPMWLAFGSDEALLYATQSVTLYSFWQEVFSNLKQAVVRLSCGDEITNYSMSMEGTSHWANFTLRLRPCSYSFQIYASDIYDNWNVTDIGGFEVTKLPSEIKLFLDGVRGDRVYDYGQTAKLRVDIEPPGREVSLWANFAGVMQLLAKGTAPLSYEVNTRDIGLGEFRLLANWSGDVDYEADEESWLLSVKDLSAPRWIGLEAAPASPTPWKVPQRYVFRVRWTDNLEVDTVLIEHNFEGVFKNVTANRHEDVWFIEVYNLSIGRYRWRSWANDTWDNWNVTPWAEYEVTKLPSEIKLFLDGVRGDRVYDYGQTAKLRVDIEPPGREVSLWANFAGVMQLLAKGTAPLSYEVNTRDIGLGEFRVKAYWPGDDVYMHDEEVWSLIVRDLSPPEWTQMRVDPPSGVYWFFRNYNFCVRWQDNLQVDTVLIEHEFEQRFVNRSMQLIGGIYCFSYPNLGIGAYRWRSVANDTTGNWASTPFATYEVRPWIPPHVFVIILVVLTNLCIIVLYFIKK